MADSLRYLVRQRAGDRCEYCHMPYAHLDAVEFHVEHIIARQHGGPDDLSNRALACSRCNRSKGPNLSSLDPATGRLVRLFHPRADTWTSHFALRGARIVGLTPEGRATVQLLKMNEAKRVQTRSLLLALGLFE